jgi:signal recognition particle subunit SRP19
VLHLRSKGKIILWPIYFDSAATWDGGRRVPKMLSIRAPRTEDIVKAAISAGLKAELTPSVAHPRFPWIKTGYVLVDSKEPKAKIIKLIAGKLPRGG